MADRYAAAFCELAREDGDPDEAVEALTTVSECFEPAMEPIFMNPEVSQEQRRELVKDVMAGQDAPLIERFLMVLVDKDRFQYLDAIVQACERKVDELKNRKHARVRSPFPLAEDQRERLRQTLGERFDARIVLEEEEDPDLIGGLQVRIDDYLLDNTISRQLQRLHRRFSLNAD